MLEAKSDSPDLRAFWALHYWNTGNSYGYSRMNVRLFEAMAPFVQYDPDAQDVISASLPKYAAPKEEGRYNYVLTMWEHDPIPKIWIDLLRERADHIIVPCSHNKELFKRALPGIPVSVCRLGVDVDIFTAVERREPKRGERFRVLFCGAANPRKGYEVASLAAQAFCKKDPTIEFYFKTTVNAGNIEEHKRKLEDKPGYLMAELDRIGVDFDTFKERVINRPDIGSTVLEMGPHKNIIMDTRDLSTDELVELYHSAHVFIYPSFGEGFGLTVAEAMSTGCPVVSIDHTGTGDFVDSRVAYPVASEPIDVTLPQYDNMTVTALRPDYKDLITGIYLAREDYQKAIGKGRRAARRIREKYTWKRAGRRLAEILRGRQC